MAPKLFHACFRRRLDKLLFQLRYDCYTTFITFRKSMVLPVSTKYFYFQRMAGGASNNMGKVLMIRRSDGSTQFLRQVGSKDGAEQNGNAVVRSVPRFVIKINSFKCI